MQALIIRPRTTAAISQLAGLFGAALAVLLIVLVIGGRELVANVAIYVGVSGFLVASAYVLWLWRWAPLAVVATPEYLGVLHRSRKRHYLPWSQVSTAAHSTGIRGMQWKLKSDEDKVVVRDIGVDHDRWAVLWHVVGDSCVAAGARVTVDPISLKLYS